MKFLTNTIIAGFIVFGLAGCEEEIFSFGSAAPAFVKTTRLEPTTVDIGGKTYVVRRNLQSYEGRTSEGWAIVFEGQPYSCSQPNKAACENALTRAEAREDSMGDDY